MTLASVGAVSCSREDSLDVRPPGTTADIEALGDRDDVNVLFVLIDTLRADRLGSYGHPEPTSPTLDYLAATGVRFADHLSQSSWTKCSMASLWTGLYPVRNGVTRFDHALPPGARMPVEILRDANFRTVGIWRNGWVAPTFGFDQGFDVYQRPAMRSKPPELRRDNPHLMLSGTDDDVIEEAIEFIRTRRNDRWFLYLHLMDVHQFVYDEESALFGSDRSGLYSNAIRREDSLINRLFAALAKEGQLTRTLAVIGSDHGEAFLERGIEGHARHVYRETTEVPLILSFPFKLPAVVVGETTRNVDIWPTVLDLLRLNDATEHDGGSRLPAILAAAAAGAAAVEATGARASSIAHLDRTWGQPSRGSAPAVSLVEGRYRVVYSREENGDETVQLYDRARDPRELSDVAADHPEELERMMSRIRRYLASEPASWVDGARSVELDEMQLNHLRALGYAIPK
ncbi:MAG: sulfatase [Myxococcota bacterium]